MTYIVRMGKRECRCAKKYTYSNKFNGLPSHFLQFWEGHETNILIYAAKFITKWLTSMITQDLFGDKAFKKSNGWVKNVYTIDKLWNKKCAVDNQNWNVNQSVKGQLRWEIFKVKSITFNTPKLKIIWKGHLNSTFHSGLWFTSN